MQRVIMTDETIDRQLRSTAQSLDTELPKSIVVLGVKFYAVGRGNYPYDCPLKKKEPNAMIYASCGKGWITETEHHFTERDRSFDCYEITEG